MAQVRGYIIPSLPLRQLRVVTLALNPATAGSPYTMALSASGGSGNYVWTLVSCTPDTNNWLMGAPTPVTIPGGILTGTPQFAETEAVVISVNDTVTGQTVQVNYTLVVQQSINGTWWAPNSVWNTKIPPGTFANQMGNSAAVINAYTTAGGNITQAFIAQGGTFTAALAIAPANQPTTTWSFSYNGTWTFTAIPATGSVATQIQNISSTFAGQGDTDRSTNLYSTDTGQMYDIYPDTNTTNGNGPIFITTASVRPLNGAGWWNQANFTTLSSGTASGADQVGGSVKPSEWAAGVIPHALMGAYPSTLTGINPGSPDANPSAGEAFIFPARGSDGFAGSGSITTGWLPEGARLQLDPSLTDAQLTSLGVPTAMLPVCHAMQTYGWYIMDIDGDFSAQIKFLSINANAAPGFNGPYPGIANLPMALMSHVAWIPGPYLVGSGTFGTGVTITGTTGQCAYTKNYGSADGLVHVGDIMTIYPTFQFGGNPGTGSLQGFNPNAVSQSTRQWWAGVSYKVSAATASTFTLQTVGGTAITSVAGTLNAYFSTTAPLDSPDSAIASGYLTTVGAPLAVPPIAPTTFDTTYSLPVGGTTWHVPAQGTLQAVINAAALGDVILVDATYTANGTITVPNKTGTGWLYIQTNNYSSLPAPGTRVTPADAVNMPTITAGAGLHCFQFNQNANHIRLVGFNLTAASGASLTSLVNCGNSDTSPSTLVNNVTFDRCYIHADGASCTRGIDIDGAYMACVDSWLQTFNVTGTDSQCIFAFNCTGPIKIYNNYLEATTENVLWGGADSKASTLIPSDIEVGFNWFHKPLSYFSYHFTTYNVKNIYETKCAQRCYIHDNIFQNVWASGQQGHAATTQIRNQSGTASWSIDTDLDYRNNVFLNVLRGWGYATTDNAQPSQYEQRVRFQDNLFVLNPGFCAGNPNGTPADCVSVTSNATDTAGASHDMTLDHNTFVAVPSFGTPALTHSLFFGNASNNPAPANWTITNNIVPPTQFGIFESGSGNDGNALPKLFNPYEFTQNAMTGRSSTTYPAGNFFPADVPTIGFNNAAIGDFSLGPSSPFLTSSKDGTVLGSRNTTQLRSLPVWVTSTWIPGATPGVAYSNQLTALGGSGNYTWSLVSASPNTGGWMHLSSSGLLTGTPPASPATEIEQWTVQILDNVTGKTIQEPMMPIYVGMQYQPAFSGTGGTSNAFPNGTHGVAYASQAITVYGGSGNYSFALNSASPNTGSWMTVTTGGATAGYFIQGFLSGTPTTAETEVWSVKVTDLTTSATLTISMPNIVIA